VFWFWFVVWSLVRVREQNKVLSEVWSIVVVKSNAPIIPKAVNRTTDQRFSATRL
jgi:hypothetical protein